MNREFFIYWGASSPFAFGMTSIRVDDTQAKLNKALPTIQELNASVTITHACNWFEEAWDRVTQALAETYLSSGRSYLVTQTPYLKGKAGRFHTAGVVTFFHSELLFEVRSDEHVHVSPLIGYHEFGLRSGVTVQPITFLSGR